MKLVMKKSNRVQFKKGYSYNPKRDGVSQSILHEFLACKESARMSVIHGRYVDVAKWPLVYGSIAHDLLEYGYLQCGDFSRGEIMAAASKAVVTHLDKEGRSSDRSEMAEIAAMIAVEIITAYFKYYWKKTDSKVKWTLIESQFRYSFGMDADAVGKVDGGFIDKNGEHVLFETKNKSRFDKDFENWLGIDMQLGYYLFGYESLIPGAKPKRALYNLLRRPNKPKFDKNFRTCMIDLENDLIKRPEFYFQRYSVKFTDQEITRHKRSIEFKIALFVNWFNKAQYTPLEQIDLEYNPGACERFGSKCAFLSHCSLGDISGLDTKPQPHMELETNG